MVLNDLDHTLILKVKEQKFLNKPLMIVVGFRQPAVETLDGDEGVQAEEAAADMARVRTISGIVFQRIIVPVQGIFPGNDVKDGMVDLMDDRFRLGDILIRI